MFSIVDAAAVVTTTVGDIGNKGCHQAEGGVLSSLVGSWNSGQLLAGQTCSSRYNHGGKNSGLGGAWGGHGVEITVSHEGILANCPAHQEGEAVSGNIVYSESGELLPLTGNIVRWWIILISRLQWRKQRLGTQRPIHSSPEWKSVWSSGNSSWQNSRGG